jgi:hypothetical protein
MTTLGWRRVAFWSAIAYGISLVLPAIGWSGSGNESFWGFQAAALSFLGAIMYIDHSSSNASSQMSECVFGALANAGYLLAYLLLIISCVRWMSRRIALAAKVIAWLARLCGVISAGILVAEAGITNSLNIGALPWIGAMGMLALGARPRDEPAPGGFPVGLADSAGA